MNNMKTLVKLIGALVLAGFMASSCSKLGSVYDDSYWRVELGSGHFITLTFEDSGQKAMVTEYAGHCGLGCGYNVEWLSGKSFNLRFSEGMDPSYSGVISGDKLSLDDLRQEEKQTYELKRSNIPE